MKFTPKYLKRYKEIALLLWRYGRSDIVAKMSEDGAIDADDLEPAAEGKATPDQLADDLEAMGPTYVKLGQVLASRPDLLPAPYLKALARLQDKVKPFSYEEVEKIVTSELGVKISSGFSRFDKEPLAAASLGQVHSAALRDGREVVVKIQRPNIQTQIKEDFEVLAEIAGFLEAHTEAGRRYRWATIIEEFRVSIQQELNYELEAHNLTTVGKNLEDFKRIQIPQPVADYCSRRVLTMDYVNGRKITGLGPLAPLEMDGAPLAEELFRAYLKQVLVDGLFHADPHPGNVFLTQDGRIALLDLGMVGHTTPGMQESLLKILMAISQGKGDKAAELVIGISSKDEGFDGAELRRRIGKLVASQQNQGLEQMNVGKSLLEVSSSAAKSGVFVPSELTLLGKTLLQLDEVGKILDPDFDPNASIRRNVDELMTQRTNKETSQGSIYSSLMEMKGFISELPNRLNRVMDIITDQKIEVKVKAVDARLVMEGFQKIANRITTGIVLAGLILGACLLMRIETGFRFLGYPGLAIICFLAAAAGGFWLVISIFVQDHRNQKKSPR
ncbi:MAG: AarF/ABC1/UbiB kinase family protein [Opitutales bacterium]|nr:AarF/ABC1/UbiB kinase family protein [Opitutales bacterium]